MSVEMWSLENEHDEDHRPGHMEVILKFRKWINDGCPGLVFSVYMCCRYGKSDTIRNLALLAIAASKASSALVIHPFPVLARQFLEETRLKSWRKRWLPSGPRLSKIQTLPDFAYRSMCDGQWLGSIHIQALMQSNQLDLALEWVKKCRAENGAAPIVFFDEAHQFSSNKWGDVARKLHAAGCIVVVLTATPFRHDGDDIFGFMKEQKKDTLSKSVRYAQRHLDDPTKLELHTVSRDQTEYTLKANAEVPFLQGWSEGCIAKATFDLIDWNMESWGKKENDSRLLSEIPEEDARAILPSLYRDPSVIAEAVRRVLSHLDNFRKHIPDATVVWYGMNDDSSSSDIAGENQKAIREAIRRANPSLKAAIATLSTDGEAGEASSELIERFCDTRRKGCDVLILKQMGSAGLDSDRICIVVLWNTVRSLDKMIQMAMRGGNSANKTHFLIVGLKDSITVDKLTDFIKESGGEYIDVVETGHKVDLIDKKDTEKSGYVPVDVADAGMTDSDGEVASFEDVRLAMHVLSIWPSLIAIDTIPQIACKAKDLGLNAPCIVGDDVFSDTTKDCDLYRKNLNEWVKRIAKRMFFNANQRKGCEEDKAEHGRLYESVAGQIKSRSGVYGSWNIKSKQRSQSPLDYQKWTAAAEYLWMEVSREKTSSAT